MLAARLSSTALWLSHPIVQVVIRIGWFRTCVLGYGFGFVCVSVVCHIGPLYESGLSRSVESTSRSIVTYTNTHAVEVLV